MCRKTGRAEALGASSAYSVTKGCQDRWQHLKPPAPLTAKAVKGIVALEVRLLAVRPCRAAAWSRAAGRAVCTGQAARRWHRVAWPQRKAVEVGHLQGRFEGGRPVCIQLWWAVDTIGHNQ